LRNDYPKPCVADCLCELLSYLLLLPLNVDMVLWLIELRFDVINAVVVPNSGSHRLVQVNTQV
jgi:hypothetical protein